MAHAVAVADRLLGQVAARGGGIYVNRGTALLSENKIVDNVGHVSYGGFGGGIYLYYVTHADVLTNIIRGNKASVSNFYSDGGGIYLNHSSAVYVAGNRIESNLTSRHATSGAGSGGGVSVWDSDAHLARNTIISNSAGTWWGYYGRDGGGVSIKSSRPATLSNNFIALNDAGIYGGRVYVGLGGPPASQALLVNNTIADNGESGVAMQWYAVLTMTNNLVAGHAVGITNTNPASSTIAADHNLFWNTNDPIVGSDGILEDPLLTADYHVRSGSPAVDAGLTIPWLTTDLEGNPRPQGSGYDIGAFEGEGVWWKLYLPLALR